MAITTVITTLPAAPDPVTMTRDQFSTAAAASVLAQKAMVPEINAWTAEVNAIVSGTAGDIASGINGATAKTTPVDADLLTLTDSAASFVLKKFTWANLKTVLGGTFAALAGSASQTFSGAAATDAAHFVRLDRGDNNVMVSAYASGATTPVTGDVLTKVLLAGERYDLSNNFASSTFTAPSAGYYRVSAGIGFDGASVTRGLIAVFVNGGAVRYLQDLWSVSSTGLRGSGSCVVLLAQGNTLELYGLITGTGTLSFTGSAAVTWLDIERIRSA